MENTDLTQMTDLQLAQLKEGVREDRPRAVLVEREFQRRDREEQHKLDLDLIKKQVRWMKFSVVAAIVAAIISAFLTYLLSQATQQKYLKLIQEISKKPTIQSPLSYPCEMIPGHPSQKATNGKSIYKDTSETSKK